MSSDLCLEVTQSLHISVVFIPSCFTVPEITEDWIGDKGSLDSRFLASSCLDCLSLAFCRAVDMSGDLCLEVTQSLHISVVLIPSCFTVPEITEDWIGDKGSLDSRFLASSCLDCLSLAFCRAVDMSGDLCLEVTQSLHIYSDCTILLCCTVQDMPYWMPVWQEQVSLLSLLEEIVTDNTFPGLVNSDAILLSKKW